MAFLEVSGIGKRNERGIVLSNISVTLAPFKKLAISGETGSGKSTLLKIIAGLAQADEGKVVFDGKRVKGPEEQLMTGHDGIAYLSQQYELRNHYRVEELLDMASKIPDVAANEIYAVCRISHLVKRRTDELSGGEKQRIALARLLVTAPRLLILDEPFSNLDLIHKSILKSVIEDISAQLRITCMLASHDPVDVLSWADEIMVLKNGAFVQQGSPQELYHQPVDEYVAGLFGHYNLIPPQLARSLGMVNVTLGNTSRFIRPEQLSIVGRDQQHAQDGVVTQVRFMGGFYEITVNVAGHSLSIISMQAPPENGSVIGIVFNAPDPVFL